MIIKINPVFLLIFILAFLFFFFDSSYSNNNGELLSNGESLSSISAADEINAELKKLFDNNKKIFFLEHMAAIKLSDENTRVEGTLNSLYSEREKACIKLAGLCRGRNAEKNMKLIKSKILNTKLYELYGLDSFVCHVLYSDDFAADKKNETANNEAAATAETEIASEKYVKDSILELKSYIELENSRLENPGFYLKELDKYMSSLNLSSEINPENNISSSSDGGYNGKEDILLFIAKEVSPGANCIDAPIDAKISIKFNIEKIKSKFFKNELKITKASFGRKYSRAAGGAIENKVQFKWDDASSSLIFTPGSRLERGEVYNASVSFEHKIQSERQADFIAADRGRGFYRSRSVNSGLFQTIDINVIDKKAGYKYDWNFQTITYQSTSSEAELLSSAAGEKNTAETSIESKSTGEVDIKDNRGTNENSVDKKKGNESKSGTNENALNKKNMMTGEFFERPDNLPMVVSRYPEGVSVMSGSEIFVIFSCDVDAKFINNNTMQLYAETLKSEFVRLKYKLKLVGRKLVLIPEKPLAPSTNHKIILTSIRTVNKLVMPLDETYHFKTACAVIKTDFSKNLKDKKNDTLEITISESLSNIGINFFEIDNKKEKPVEFDECGKKPVPEPALSKPAIKSIALGAPAASLSKEQKNIKTINHNDIKIKTNASEKGPVIIMIRPRTALVKGRDYKIDVFSADGIIENGIIKFSVK